jgi:DNA-binding response OmpR family regulator
MQVQGISAQVRCPSPLTKERDNAMSRILLVEDHERLALLVCKGLAAAGIAVDVVDRVDAAWATIRRMPYQVLVIDRGLPDGDGLVLLQRMRRAGIGMPCLVLTARDALHDRVEGLDAGADDYLPKPFHMDEMVARVRALLRRPVEVRPLDPSHGDLALRPAAGIMSCGKESVTLAPAEMQIMLLLLRKECGYDTNSIVNAGNKLSSKKLSKVVG